MNSDDPSCVTASGAACKENARDMALEVILEEWTDTCIIQRSATISIPIWVKVVIW